MRSFATLVILLVLSLVPAALSSAQQSTAPDLSPRQLSLLYGDFKALRSFGLVAVSLAGDAESIGLNEKELTNYVKLKFKEHLGSIKLDDTSRSSQKFLALVATKERSVGNMTFRVWVVGEDYPLAYHVRCDAGNFENPSIWTEEILGHGSKKTLPDAIRNIINEMIKEFARIFTTVRGQQM